MCRDVSAQLISPQLAHRHNPEACLSAARLPASTAFEPLHMTQTRKLQAQQGGLRLPCLPGFTCCGWSAARPPGGTGSGWHETVDSAGHTRATSPSSSRSASCRAEKTLPAASRSVMHCARLCERRRGRSSVRMKEHTMSWRSRKPSTSCRGHTASALRLMQGASVPPEVWQLQHQSSPAEETELEPAGVMQH